MGKLVRPMPSIFAGRSRGPSSNASPSFEWPDLCRSAAVCPPSGPWAASGVTASVTNRATGIRTRKRMRTTPPRMRGDRDCSRTGRAGQARWRAVVYGADEGNGLNTKDRRQRRRNEGPVAPREARAACHSPALWPAMRPVRCSTQLDGLRSVSVTLRSFVLNPLSPSPRRRDRVSSVRGSPSSMPGSCAAPRGCGSAPSSGRTNATGR